MTMMSGSPLAGQVADGDVRWCDAGGHRDGCREVSRRSLEGDRDAVIQRVGGDQVVESVSGQVGGGEARGQDRGLKTRVRAGDLSASALTV